MHATFYRRKNADERRHRFKAIGFASIGDDNGFDFSARWN